MTNSNHVEQIAVTVTLASGEQHTLTSHRPGPQGDNPRFLAQQLAAGMEGLGERLDTLADLYGDQIRSAEGGYTEAHRERNERMTWAG